MSEQSSISTTKVCSTCAHPIPATAKKCTECSTYQDWRRHIGFSTTMVALLTALISVLTVALPVVKGFLRKDMSDISVHLHTWTPDRVILIALNKGTLPGGIAAADIEIEKPDGQFELAISLSFPPNSDLGFLPAASSRQVVLAPDISKPNRIAIDIGEKCAIRIGISDFGAAQLRSNRSPFPCHAISPLLDTLRKLRNAMPRT